LLLLFSLTALQSVGCGEPLDSESAQESTVLDASTPEGSLSESTPGTENANPEPTPEQQPPATEVFAVMADIQNCKTGKITSAAKQAALKRVNDIRKIHGLQPVTYNSALDADVMAAALIIVANSTITHYPKPDALCYSEAAKNGSAKSNIGVSFSTRDKAPDMPSVPAKVDGWLRDDRNVQPGVGHRRWILNPFLKHVAFGYAFGKSPKPRPRFPYVTGSALFVLDSKTNVDPVPGGFVAYPFKKYPRTLWNPKTFLSFSAVYNTSSPFRNKKVDYSQAKIEVKSPQGPMTVSDISSNTKGAGVPNVIIWKVNGLQPNVKYDVSLSNVTVEGQSKSYNYSFTLE